MKYQNSKVHIDLQIEVSAVTVPEKKFFQNVAEETLMEFKSSFDLLMRLVEVSESRFLNNRYRRSDWPTNVLSFRSSGIEEVLPNYIGDIVMCPSVIKNEAGEQKKSLDAHWAHMIVHGILHLVGFDHGTEDEALIMEERERRVLSGLQISDPYIYGGCEQNTSGSGELC